MYDAFCKCMNCSYTGLLKFKLGKQIKQTKCPDCKCLTLAPDIDCPVGEYM